MEDGQRLERVTDVRETLVAKPLVFAGLCELRWRGQVFGVTAACSATSTILKSTISTLRQALSRLFRPSFPSVYTSTGKPSPCLVMSTPESLPDPVPKRKLTGWELYRDVLKSPTRIVGPMVDQSELVSECDLVVTNTAMAYSASARPGESFPGDSVLRYIRLAIYGFARSSYLILSISS